MHETKNGYFVISLDFELYWGVRDKKTLEGYGENIRNVRKAVPELLALFKQYDICATWATVGFLFHRTKDELLQNIPFKKPNYANKKLNPYEYIANIGENEDTDIFHYGSSLIKLILTYPGQEIASHTFSHYYCLEEGQDIQAFEQDLKAAVLAAKRYNIELGSLIFPRNQVNGEYLRKCRELGFKAYRGCQPSWIYEERKSSKESWFRRGLRLLDAYANIYGHNSICFERIAKEYPVNLCASRFLRPYSQKLKLLEPLRLKRIMSDLSFAAKKDLIYHLWWHPHNFGKNMKENFNFLQKILIHFSSLRDKYGMQSINMTGLAKKIMGKSIGGKI